MEIYEAVVGGLNLPTMTCHSRCRRKFNRWIPMDGRFTASKLRTALPRLGQFETAKSLAWASFDRPYHSCRS